MENKFKNNYLLIANVLAVVLTSGYVLATTKYAPALYLVLVLMALLNLLFVLMCRVTLNSRRFYFVIFMLAYLFITVAISSFFNPSAENFSSALKFMIIAIFCSSIIFIYDFKQLAKQYVVVMYWVSISSIFGYLIVNLFQLDLPLPVFTNSNDINYRGALVFYYFDDFLKFRNVGVFWEPGLFATMIFAALIAQHFTFFNKGKYSTAIFLIALITTFSSAAIILLFFYFAFLFFDSKRESNNNYGFFNYIIIAFILVLAFFLMYEAVVSIGVDPMRAFNKILNFSESESHRLLSPTINYSLFIDKPIYGWGLTDGLKSYVGVADISMTSTTTFYLMAFGVLGLLLSISPALILFTRVELGLLQRVILFLAFMFILNKEPHIYFSISYLILMYLSIDFYIRLTFLHGRLSSS